jgi:hypothetical protein
MSKIKILLRKYWILPSLWGCVIVNSDYKVLLKIFPIAVQAPGFKQMLLFKLDNTVLLNIHHYQNTLVVFRGSQYDMIQSEK